jgi:alpha-beta hydrolase superfamily lysophospholipase
MKHQIGTLTADDGTSLFMQHWLPDADSAIQGYIIIAHGYADHSSRFEHVAAYFVNQGYAVYAMDSRGHGQSRGKTLGYFERFDRLADDLAGFVKQVYAERMTNRPLFLIGHSMGGLLSLYYVIRHKPPLAMLRGLVTSGALLDAGEGVPGSQTFLVRQVLSPLLPQQGTITLDSGTISKDPAVVQAYDNDPNVYRGKLPARVAAEFIAAREYVVPNLNKIMLPILCMHGGADRLVNPKCTRLIYEKVGSSDKTIKIYDGLYHEIMNEPERTRVLADIWVWLAAHGSTGELRPR